MYERVQEIISGTASHMWGKLYPKGGLLVTNLVSNSAVCDIWLAYPLATGQIVERGRERGEVKEKEGLVRKLNTERVGQFESLAGKNKEIQEKQQAADAQLTREDTVLTLPSLQPCLSVRGYPRVSKILCTCAWICVQDWYMRWAYVLVNCLDLCVCTCVLFSVCVWGRVFFSLGPSCF